jgi:hypothetical protein
VLGRERRVLELRCGRTASEQAARPWSKKSSASPTIASGALTVFLPLSRWRSAPGPVDLRLMDEHGKTQIGRATSRETVDWRRLEAAHAEAKMKRLPVCI